VIRHERCAAREKDEEQQGARLAVGIGFLIIFIHARESRQRKDDTNSARMMG
jgi:hypothetical protein